MLPYLRELRLPYVLQPDVQPELRLPSSIVPAAVPPPELLSTCQRLRNASASQNGTALNVTGILADMSLAGVELHVPSLGGLIDQACDCAARSAPLRTAAPHASHAVAAASSGAVERTLRLAATLHALTERVFADRGFLTDVLRRLRSAREAGTRGSAAANRTWTAANGWIDQLEESIGWGALAASRHGAAPWHSLIEPVFVRYVGATALAAESYAASLAADPRGAAVARSMPLASRQLSAALANHLMLSVAEERRALGPRAGPASPNARAGELLAQAAGRHTARAYVDLYTSWALAAAAASGGRGGSGGGGGDSDGGRGRGGGGGFGEAEAAALLAPSVLCAPAEDYFWRRFVALHFALAHELGSRRRLAAAAPAHATSAPVLAAMDATATGRDDGSWRTAWGTANEAAAYAYTAAEAAFGWREAAQDEQANFLTAVPSMVGQ